MATLASEQAVYIDDLDPDVERKIGA